MERKQRVHGYVTLAVGVCSAALVAVAVAVPASAAEGAVVPAREPTPGGYIVELKDGVHATSSAQAIEQASVSLVTRYGGQLKSTFTATIHGFAVKNMPERQARRLAADPSVQTVYQDGTARITDVQPNPPAWGIDRVDQKNLPLDKRYEYKNTANDVTVYVTDTGTRFTHTEFEGRATSGYDFVDEDPNADDCNGHGTHTAGTIGGKTYGVAKKAKLVAVRMLGCNGSAPDSDGIEAVEWVTKNAKKPATVNASWGFDVADIGDKAIDALINSGVSFVASAGNNNGDACAQGPAKIPAVITVGATDNRDNRSSFSNFGKCVDIFAPGSNILSAAHQSDNASATLSGTSMSSPHVAGAAALYLQTMPNASPEDVAKALTSNATSGVVNNPGAGSPNLMLYTLNFAR
ncbi:S8 family peptidase [Streptomyces sp. KR80]|uniref:S8 family peptidase n=1 Tax=Streptomyces sp. KR80 TaxID=3457426 RepID=UPI003FD3300A